MDELNEPSNRITTSLGLACWLAYWVGILGALILSALVVIYR